MIYLFGLLLACGVVALARRPGWGRFWWLCALAGLGGLIRPTLVFYGMATLLTASAVLALAMGKALPTAPWLAAEKLPGVRILGDRRWWTGVAIYLGGGALLWGTNLVRFGDGFEFGHRLNVQGGTLLGSIYATRFDHPFQAEPLWRAGRELLGALFAVRRFNGADWYATAIFAGQSPTVRWREFYFTTYDWSYLLGEDVSQWGIRFNGAGWASDGTVQASLILFVDDPRFLALELVSASGIEWGREEAKCIRAKVGLEWLKQESLERTEDGWRVRFAGPTRARYQTGLQAVFVAMVSKDRLAEARTGWMLRRVSWRKERRRTGR